MLNKIEKIYVCHYTKLVDRAPVLQEQLDNYELDATWVKKYDKEDITNENLVSILPKFDDVFEHAGSFRKLRLPEISLMLKHYHIWCDMVKNNIDNVLVLEDDALLSDDFVSKFNIQISDLDKGYDVIWVGSCCNLHTHGNSHLIPRKQSRCTHGYMLSLKCAKVLLDNIKYNNYPVDFYFNNIINSNDMNSYWMEPDLISQNPIFETTIQNKN